MGGRKFSGDRDGAFFQIRETDARPGDDERTAAPAERSAGAEQRIAFTQMAKGMVRNFGNIEFVVERQTVERLHVFKLFAELDTRDVHSPVNERIENKRVVRAW